MTAGPVVVSIGWWSAMRFGSWRGPVGFSGTDIALLLLAPIPIALMVRPKLDHAMMLAAIAGALAAGIVVLLVREPEGLNAARLLATILGAGAVSASSVAVSWLVQSSKSAARWVRRGTPLVWSLILALWLTETHHRSSLD
jgi:hypothetical protein